MGCGKTKILGDPYVDAPRTFWSISINKSDNISYTMYEFNKKKGYIIVNLPDQPPGAIKLCRKFNKLSNSLSETGVIVLGVISNLSKENKEDPASKSTIVWDSEANFTVFAKVFANGLKAHQIFRYLRINSSLYNTNTKRSLPLETYGNMFLLDENGNVVKLYSSNTSVSKMVSEVKKMLPKT